MRIASLVRLKTASYLIFCSLFVFLSSFSFGENACFFQVSRGNASFQAKGQTEWESIGNQKVPISIGDKIKSGPETRGELSFPDGSIFRLKSDTILVLHNEGVQLQVGETWFNLQKQGRNFQVVTPSSVCGVMGTTFDVSVDKSGGTRVRVFDGVVGVQNNFDKTKRRLELTRGQTVETGLLSKLPERPKAFSVDQAIKSEPDLKPMKLVPPGLKPGLPPGNHPGLPDVQPPGLQPGFPPGTHIEPTPGLQPGVRPGGSQGNRPETQPGFQPGAHFEPPPGHQPEVRPGDRPDPRSGNQPGVRSGDRPDHSSGNQPGVRPGDRPDHSSGNQPGVRPGDRPDPRSGNQPGVRPGERPDPRSGNQPGVRPGAEPGPRQGTFRQEDNRHGQNQVPSREMIQGIRPPPQADTHSSSRPSPQQRDQFQNQMSGTNPIKH